MKLRGGKNLNKGGEAGQDMSNVGKKSDERNEDERSNLEGDYQNVALLFFLYVLQGIPLGMAGSIPMILQNKNVSYKQQAMFSFVYWPFSLKLLWAPIVDAAFFQKFGRRKTWLVPVQYLIAFFMIVLSSVSCDFQFNFFSFSQFHFITEMLLAMFFS